MKHFPHAQFFSYPLQIFRQARKIQGNFFTAGLITKSAIFVECEIKVLKMGIRGVVQVTHTCIPRLSRCITVIDFLQFNCCIKLRWFCLFYTVDSYIILQRLFASFGLRPLLARRSFQLTFVIKEEASSPNHSYYTLACQFIGNWKCL